MLQTNGGTTGGTISGRVEAALGRLMLRSVGGAADRIVPCRVSDAPGGSVRRVSGTLGGSVRRVSGTLGGLVLRCVVGMLCVVLVAAGCSDDGSNAVRSVTTTPPSTTAAPINASSPTTTTTVSAPTTTAAPPPTTTAAPPTTTGAPSTTGVPMSEEEQIFAAIERYYEVLVEANDPPNPDSPLWDDVAVPEFAEALRARTRENLGMRKAVRWAEDRQPWVKSPHIVWRQGSIAVIDLCLRDNGVVYDLDTKEVIDDSVGYYWRQMTVANRSGNWLVSGNQRVEKFDTEEACIASYQ